MQEPSPTGGDRGPSTASLEIAVALILIAIGALVMKDSARIGAGWASDGPRAGYFPFYLGLLIVGSSAMTLLLTVRKMIRGDASMRGTFVTMDRLRLVLAVLIPLFVFVSIIPFVGIYAPAAVLIALFMSWLGRYGAWKTLMVAIAVPVVAFVLFEIWFLVPLPKGPIENMLGY